MHFEDPMENRASEVVLSFIVADTADGCTPSWGTYTASTPRPERSISTGGSPGCANVTEISWCPSAGAINDELARTCAEVDRARRRLQLGGGRYDATTLDFDIEGAAIAEPPPTSGAAPRSPSSRPNRTTAELPSG